MSTDWLFSASELQLTPSRRDGVSLTSELERRGVACRLLARLAAALRVSLATQRSACVFLHRFLMRRSLLQCDERVAAAACLLLAAKAENDETRAVDVRRLAQALITGHTVASSEVQTVRDILQLEGDVLVALGFELEVDHSFCYIAAGVDKVVALPALEPRANELRLKLKQVAWSFLNDSAITWTCLAVDAPLAAKAAVFAAGLFQGCVSEDALTRESQPWWTVLQTPVDVLKDAARHVLSAYMDPFVDTSVLPSALVELVSVFHSKTESSDVCVLESEVPLEAETTPCNPLVDDFKQVEIDAEILFRSVEASPASDVEHTTAWIDDCVVVVKGQESPSSPSDPCAVEKSIPLYSPLNRVMDPCTEGSLRLKRSITLADSGRVIKKAKFAL
ncbi:hypothetical protein PF001_g23962 [Phytophthora fragariae]|uniref:Cyclin N-terminal domain-containing protein n=1 Tax=Phytophthora fragariae TaxID=53985 RepID=A0A6A4BVN4_9STRA|nr:hypothetical protein PF001_g23962 [Phytophthora fragariae]